jgi:hypothetical protein
VDLTVLWRPEHSRLCFWALQASFGGSQGKTGAAHTGLQWNARHPRNRAVNWGGYHTAGAVLDGTPSRLASAPGHVNTLDYEWEPGVRYRFRIEQSPEPGWWSAFVTAPDGDPLEIRRLHGGGDRLTAPVVWSEIFAACDDPSVAVRWEDPVAFTDTGPVRPRAYRVTYGSVERGSCSNTTVLVSDGGVLQVTNVERLVDAESVIPTG